MKKPFLTRRAFLRGTVGGAAISLALPPLEAFMPGRGAKADAASARPIFGVFFWANGVPWHARHGQLQAGGRDVWTPSTQGEAYAPSELLSELSRHQVSVATGLEPKTTWPDTPPGQSDGHMRGFMVSMTGDRVRPEGFDHPSHTLTSVRPSIDQYVARHSSFYAGGAPRYRSVHMGASRIRFHEYGHWDAISHNGPDSTNPPIMSPRQLYQMLFAVPTDVAEIGRRTRLLDGVLDDARALRTRLGGADRIRLEAHLENLNEIQLRLDRSASACQQPAMPGDGGDLMDITIAHAQLLALALQCDITRVFTFMLTSPATNHVFSNVGAPDAMHKVCHDGLWDHVFAITRYQMQVFARFLDVLNDSRDPMGVSVLDRSCILGLSEYGEGFKHSTAEMPAVIAGGAGGAIRRNVHVREEGGNFSKVHLTALRAIGLNQPSWGWNGGETTDHLSGILV